ncbi:MAG: excisionase family DNA-binding protein [Bryobacteraceae bacterium]|jgi:excisionase family DNA binding protein
MPALSHSVLKALRIPEREQRDIEALYSELTARKPVRIVCAGGRRVEIPASLRSFLLDLLRDLRDGQSVTVMHGQESLTTAQAGSILGMSRQFLVDLLEAGAMPYHMVGSHRRVYFSDILRYKQARDRQRRKILERMVKSEDALYDLMPENVHPQKRAKRRS